MATIQARKAKDGSVSWRVQVRLRGAPPASASFARKTDAKRWGAQTESAIRNGKYFATAEAARHTLQEVIARYRDEVMPYKRDSTSRVQLGHLSWWADRIGEVTLDRLTAPLVIEARTFLTRDGRSPSTANRYVASLGHVLKVAARDWGWLEGSPMARVKSLKEPRGRTRVLTDDERDDLLAACKASTRPELYSVVVLALSTGARRGEIVSLEWKNVDLKRGTVTFEDTKNDDPRTIPVFGLALAELQALSTHRGTDNRPLSALVFPDATGRKPIRLRFHWERAVKEAKIENLRFHDLRHCAGTWLSRCGATAPQIAAVLGHRQWAMSQRYTHYNTEHSADLLKRMTETFVVT